MTRNARFIPLYVCITGARDTSENSNNFNCFCEIKRRKNGKTIKQFHSSASQQRSEEKNSHRIIATQTMMN
jgi:hypothetical protein